MADKSPEERLAVVEDRMERTHRDFSEVKGTIEKLDRFVRDHMDKEEADREKDREFLLGELGKIYIKINATDKGISNRKGFVLGVVFATSVVWTVGIAAVSVYIKFLA